jgi:phosphoglycerol transferase
MARMAGVRVLTSRLAPLAPYAGAVGLCVLLLTFVLQLWRADLRVPFQYYGDAVWNLALVKGLLEDGWYLHNDCLGAPGSMDLHDFPFVDSLFFVMLKGLALATHDFTLALNLFFLLTFPLTTLSSLLVLRRFQVSTGPAVVASLLYTFLPYHLLRGEGHVFLAAYFLVPLAVELMLRVYLGPERRGVSPPVGAVVVCLLLGCAGVYYAFFTCFFLLVAGAASAARRRTLYPLGAAGLLIAVITLAVAVNLLPTWIYQLRQGPNRQAVDRTAYHAEHMCLKAADLVLPVDKHRVRRLAHWKAMYSDQFTPVWRETNYSTLGLAGAAGFLLLLGRLFVRRPCTRVGLADGLAALNASALALGCSGGGGALFSLYVSPMIRGYSRVCVFIAFFALLALARLVDRLPRRLHSPRGRWLYRGGLAVALGLGVLDQCPPWFVPPYDKLKEIYSAEAQFVGRIEATLPPGSMIFQLPSVHFPEGPCNPSWASTDHFRCYLHSRHLRWSYGCMHGREVDRWRLEVSGQPLPQMVQTLAATGFRGIVVDRAGYADLAAKLEPELTRLLGVEPVVSRGHDCRYSFYDLTPYARRRRHAIASPPGPADQRAAPDLRRTDAERALDQAGADELVLGGVPSDGIPLLWQPHHPAVRHGELPVRGPEQRVLLGSVQRALQHGNVKGDPVVRLLIAPSWYLHAFWLADGNNHQVYVIDVPTSFTHVQAGQLYPAKEFLQLLAKERPASGFMP